jgi:hypothetical protein
MSLEENNNKRLKTSHNNTPTSNDTKIEYPLISDLDKDTSSIALDYVGIEDLSKSWNLYQSDVLSQFQSKLPDMNECAKNGDLATLKYLIYLGIKPEYKIFYYACKGGNSELIEYLLGLKFRPRSRNDLSWFHLCKNSSIDVFIKTYHIYRKEKIHNGLEFGEKCCKLRNLGMSIVKHAILHKRKDIIDFLLEHISVIREFRVGISKQYRELYNEKIEYPEKDEAENEFYSDSDDEFYYSDDDAGYDSYNEDNNTHLKTGKNYNPFKYNHYFLDN